MIARLSLRHVMLRKIGMAALIALAAIGLAGTAKSQGVDQPPQVSPAQLALAKQIVEIKGVRAMFAPLVHGVIKKTVDSVMQTNMMWGKDINDIAAQMEKDYQPRGQEVVDATARFYASHFTEAELKQILSLLPIAGRSENAGRGAEGARRKHGLCGQLGRRSFHPSHE